FKAWGVGSKQTNRGVLILLSVQDRRYRIEVGYGLEPILPDGKVGGFGREAVPFLQKGQYGPALQLITSRVAETIAADAQVGLEGNNPSAPPRKVTGHSSPIGTIIIIVILVLLLA